MAGRFQFRFSEICTAGRVLNFTIYRNMEPKSSVNIAYDQSIRTKMIALLRQRIIMKLMAVLDFMISQMLRGKDVLYEAGICFPL